MPLPWSAAFASALPLTEFLARHATAEQKTRWADFAQRVSLTAAQRTLLTGFAREMNVLILAGAWCGDCIQQCPILEQFAVVQPKIAIRYVDRDADLELKTALSIMGGARVPLVVILSEEGNEVLRYGDKTLSKLRQVAHDQLGPSCPTGLVAPPPELIAAVTQDWVDVFERAHLMLRLSPRLREKYGD